MTFTIQDITIESEGNVLAGRLVYQDNTSLPPGILFIHGSGNEKGHELFNEWQDYLAQHGYSSLAYNSRGVPKGKPTSGGSYEEGGLNNRLKDASNVLKYFINTGKVDPSQIGVQGTSMGAHVAMRLAEAFPDNIKIVMLEGGAAYSAEGEDKPLNQEFSNVIRKENSWADSPIFRFLKRSRLPLYLVYGKADTVIPEGVKEKYKSFLKDPKDLLMIPRADHGFIRNETPEEKLAYQQMLEGSLKFLQKYLPIKVDE